MPTHSTKTNTGSGSGAGSSSHSHSSNKKKSGKVAFTDSKIGRHEGPIYTLAAKFQEHLFLPDVRALYALIGGVAANMITGNPFWLMLVGAPGSGKTEMLRSICGLPNMHRVDSIESKAAFLSGVKKKEQAVGAKGGLLREVGEYGALVWWEFTSVLEMGKDQLKSVLSALRSIYDGEFVRDVGTEGGKKLFWEGKIAVFGGVTNAIDRAHEFGAVMGERFVLFRMPDSDGFGESMAILRQTDLTLMRKELRLAVDNFFDALDLSWEAPQNKRQLNMLETQAVIALSQFAVKARSGIQRDYSSREIVEVPSSEQPQRFVSVFHQLYIGMEICGLDAEDRWAVLTKIAFDSMPLTRRTALQIICGVGLTGYADEKPDYTRSVGLGELQRVMKVSQTTVRRTMEDLVAHGVVEKDPDNSAQWKMSEWALDKLEMARAAVKRANR